MDENCIEKISHEDQLYAIIIRESATTVNSIEFLTDNDNQFQIGIMNKNDCDVITPHFHKPVKRVLYNTPEVIIVKKGNLETYIYDENNNKIFTRILSEGDIIYLNKGGHSFKAIGNAKIIEIKQGPFITTKVDKERFYPEKN